MTRPALKLVGFSEIARRATCRVSTGTTWLAARILGWLKPTDSVGYTATWNELTVTADTKNVRAANHISGRYRSALAATVDPLALVPLPAYGTHLRGIMFVLLNCTTSLVVELIDQLGIAGARNRLRLPPPKLVGGIVERLAHIARRAGKGIHDLARGFVCQIADAIRGFAQQFGFALLQPLPAPCAFRMPALPLLDGGQAFVAPLHRRLCRTSTYQDGLAAICRGD